MEKVNKKFYNVSLLRMISTIIIVVFHILLELHVGEGKTWFPLYIGVPIFCFISGYLYSGKKIDDVKKFYKNNILKILLPAGVFLLICFFVCGIYSICSNTSLISLFIDNTKNGNFAFSIGHLWFIPAILLCYLIVPLLHNLYDRKIKSWGGVFKYLPLFVILEFACIALCTSVIIPFIAGFIINKNKEKINKNIKPVIIFSLLAFAGLCVGYPFIFKLSSTNTIINFLFHYVNEIYVGIMGILVSMLFLLFTERINFSSGMQKLLSKFDKLSFPIYFVHQIFIFGVFNVLHITNITIVNILICFILVFVIAILFNLLMNIIWKGINKLEMKKKEVVKTESVDLDELKKELV